MILVTGGAGFIGSNFILDRRCVKDRTSAIRRPPEAGEQGETGIRKTVRRHLDHQDWVANVSSGGYRDWIDTHYGATRT